MAEQFKKTYISAREFVGSWEKEIYELTNLDYFIFLLMNDLASVIESDYFSKTTKRDQTHLSGEEIGTLAFNVCDSLQLFLEKNCFDACSFACPCKLHEKIDVNENNAHYSLLMEIKGTPYVCKTKEECLYNDIFSYVALDTIFDFYNYEIGVPVEYDDLWLAEFSNFINEVMIDFMKNKGQHLLHAPFDNAADIFNDLLHADDSDWEDFIPDEEDDEESAAESWKSQHHSVANLLDEFKENYRTNFGELPELRVVDKFQEYLIDFLELKKMDDSTIDDVEEFFTLILIHDLLSDDQIAFEAVAAVFSQLMNFLEFNYDVPLKTPFEQFLEEGFPELLRCFRLTRDYQKQHSYIDFMLSPANKSESLIDGFFEIIAHEDDLFALEEIHIKSEMRTAVLPNLPSHDLREGDILHIHLVAGDFGWEMAYLEMIYPARARFFLF